MCRFQDLEILISKNCKEHCSKKEYFDEAIERDISLVINKTNIEKSDGSVFLHLLLGKKQKEKEPRKKGNFKITTYSDKIKIAETPENEDPDKKSKMIDGVR